MVSQRMKWLARSWVPLVVLTCSAIFAYSPLLWQLERSLASQPMYWSMWFLPVAALYLAQKRLIGCEVQARADGAATAIISVMAWIVLAIAILLWSPWLAGVSLLVLLLGAACYWWGAAGLRRVAPVWAILWLALPLPIELDESLIARLRLETTTWASVLLDIFGVVHSTAGNVIELPGHRLFTAAACSGMHSLQAMLGCGGFYVLWRRRRVLRATLFLSVAILISVGSNSVRVASLVWLAAHHIDFTTGFLGHTVSGLLFFGVALVIAWSWDQTLAWLAALAYAYSPFPLPWPTAGVLAPNFQGLPGSVPALTVAPATSETVAVDRGSPVLGWLGNGRLGVRFLYTASLAFGALGILQFTQPAAATAGRVEPPRTASPPMLELSPLEASSLDQVVHGWNRMAYEVNPDGAGMTGGHCVTWRFYRPGQSLAVCVAYPYAALHDIRTCYEHSGWQVMHSEPADLLELGPASDGVDAIKADLAQDTNRRGYLLFAFLDASGELAPLDDLLDRDLWQRIKDRLAHPRGGRREAASLRTENLVQFQVFLEAYRPLTPSERLEMQRLLQESVRKLAHKTP